ESLPSKIRLNVTLDRFQVRENVLMAYAHALWFGGGARCEDYFGDVGGIDALRREVSVSRPGIVTIDFVQPEARQRGRDLARTVVKQELWLNLSLNASGEFIGAFAVKRHYDGPSQQATKKRGHPLRAVFRLQKDAIAFVHASRLKLSCDF